MTCLFLFLGESAVRCEEVRQTCVHRYFVAIGGDTNDFTAVHLEYTRCRLLYISYSSVVVIVVTWGDYVEIHILNVYPQSQ